MGRQPCCDKVGLKRGPWSLEEDRKLTSLIMNNGVQCWRHVPKLAGLMRCGKSCRLRWINYPRPDLKRGALSEAEEEQIIRLHSRHGNRWSKIASHLPGRTDNEIKNQWNTRIKKKLKLLRLDPETHQPVVKQPSSNIAESCRSQPEEEIMGTVDLGCATNETLSTESVTKSDFDFKGKRNEEKKSKPSSCCSTSFSVDDSHNNYMEGPHLEGSSRYLSDSSGSLPSWEAMYQFDDVFSFGDYLLD